MMLPSVLMNFVWLKDSVKLNWPGVEIKQKYCLHVRVTEHLHVRKIKCLFCH